MFFDQFSTKFFGSIQFFLSIGSDFIYCSDQFWHTVYFKIISWHCLGYISWHLHFVFLLWSTFICFECASPNMCWYMHLFYCDFYCLKGGSFCIMWKLPKFGLHMISLHNCWRVEDNYRCKILKILVFIRKMLLTLRKWFIFSWWALNL